MKRVALVLILAIGGLYLVRDVLPAGWFGFDYGPALSAPSAMEELQKSVNGAFKRVGGQF